MKILGGLTGVCLLLGSSYAWSWGHTGHVEISRIAIDKLPDEIPSFVRNGLAEAAIGELGPEADESKTTGIITGVSSTGSILTTRTVHDAERELPRRPNIRAAISPTRSSMVSNSCARISACGAPTAA